MKSITCDFCEKPSETHVVRELRLVIRAQPYDQPSYPAQNYELKAYDICADCAANLRNADKIHIAIPPPKK